MSEGDTFSTLVREAFIEPLRSVLIVDDQYPTWEEILGSKANAADRPDTLRTHPSQKDWAKSGAGDALRVIHEFRSQRPGYVIDIHDGVGSCPPNVESSSNLQETASELADHLHQSDLLVLDYNLEGKLATLGGAKARKILRTVLTNKHFNLIVIHTAEPDLDHVLAECVISLMEKCTSSFSENMNARLRELDDKLDELEVEGKFVREELGEKLTIRQYLDFRESCNSIQDAVRKYLAGDGAFASLSVWVTEIGLIDNDRRYFLYWALREFERARSDVFSDEATESLSWKFDSRNRWLRTSKGFVTFVKKGTTNLLPELQRALECWKPNPSRLLSAKYRHALSSVGVAAEDKSLSKIGVFAQFYDNIREPARDGLSPEQAKLSREFKLKEHVSRQSEAISFIIEDDLVKFGEKIVRVDERSGNVFSSYYNIDLSNTETKKKSINEYNSYISTLPQKNDDDQLDSGHIFKLNNEWWVCATPACDLQPGQNTIAFIGESSDLRPFTAIKLATINSDELSNDHINSGSYCFIEDSKSNNITCLGLKTISEELRPGTQKITWRTFVAKKQGLISLGKCKVITPKLSNGSVETPECTIEVLAKLRYEYALNFIQRVGASVSRIGLGYASYPGAVRCDPKSR